MRQADQPGLPSAPIDQPRPPIVSVAVQGALLALARVALAAATGRTDSRVLERALRACRDGDGRGAVFVTLTEAGALRGCVGSLDPNRSLREAVVGSAIGASLEDSRFPPVASGELPAIHVEISVLGPTSPLPDPRSFRPGVDGVIVERSGRRALLLPEVATEFSLGTSAMLAAVCRKAGLPTDGWRDPRTTVRTFRTVRFGGPAMSAH